MKSKILPDNKRIIKNVVGYTRVSTYDQSRGDFTSLDNQEKEIRDYAEKNKWTVLKIYTDTASGASIEKRTGYKNMLTELERNNATIDAVLVYKLDRLSRSQRDFYEFFKTLDELDMYFISTTQRIDTSDAMGKFFRDMLIIFAAFERELTSERTFEKQYAMAEKGAWLGGYVPYGYKAVNKKLIVDEQEAEMVKLAFQKYLELATTTKLANFLNAEGYRTKKRGISPGEKKFTRDAVLHLLNNIQATGKINFGNKVFKGAHKPIISDELFNRVQKLLKVSGDNTHMTTIPKGDYYLLELIKCGYCKHDTRVATGEYYYMTASRSIKHLADGTKKPYYYYRCVNCNKKSAEVCQMGQVQKDLIENFVFSKLFELAKKPGLLEKILETADKEKKIDVEKLKIKHKNAENERKRIDKILKSSFEKFAEAIEEKNNPIANEIKKFQDERKVLQQQIDEMNFEIKSKEQNLISKKALIFAYNHLEKILKDGKKEEIIDFVKLLIHEVIVKIDKNTKHGEIIIKPHILPAEITKVFIGSEEDKEPRKKEKCEPVNLSLISSHLCSSWLRWRDSNPRPSG